MGLNTTVFLYLCLSMSVFAAAVILELPDGKVLGKKNHTTTENNSFYSFKGIPYASPPVGSLRFQAPIPPEPWSNVLNATVEGSACIRQKNLSDYPNPQPTDEDCLFINVYTPSIKKGSKLPVLFWIFGGGFVDGDGNSINYGPDHFIDQNVVLVTFNYRLGAFGFLSTGDKEILGNAGLKDQILALKWTQNNIRYFGGDAKKITIFGESSGGMAVGLHLLSEKSAGLFSAAICHSGCSLSSTMLSNPKSVAYEIANAAWPNYDWNKSSTAEIKEFLTSLTTEELFNASLSIDSHKFIPTLEIEDEDAFLSQPNYELIDSGRFNKVPLIIGQVSEESLGFLNELVSAQNAASVYDRNVTALVPATMNVSKNANLEEIGQIIKQSYVGNDTFSGNIAQLLNYDSYNRFTRATLKQAELQSKYSPVYMYVFSFYGCKSVTHYTVEGAGKVAHFDDIPYFFKMETFPCNESLISKKVTKLWANFANHHNPTPQKDDLFNNIIWEPVEHGKIQYLDIDSNVSMVDVTNYGPRKMWNNIYEKYAVRPFVVY